MKKRFIFIILFFMICLSGCMKHIEDTNGSDFTIQTFNDADIVSNKNHYLAFGRITITINNQTKLTIKKFSGIEELNETEISNHTLTYNITTKCLQGNFLIVIIKDNEIIQDIDVNGDSTYTYNDAGTYSLRIVGESAKFEIVYAITKLKTHDL